MGNDEADKLSEYLESKDKDVQLMYYIQRFGELMWDVARDNDEQYLNAEMQEIYEIEQNLKMENAQPYCPECGFKARVTEEDGQDIEQHSMVVKCDNCGCDCIISYGGLIE